MAKRSANNFLIARDGMYFLIHRWSPDLSMYQTIGWLDRYQEIDHFIRCCYHDQKVPYRTHVTFDLKLDNEIFTITERPLYTQYLEYDYEQWTYNGKYTFGSKDWKRIMDYTVTFRRLSHAD